MRNSTAIANRRTSTAIDSNDQNHRRSVADKPTPARYAARVIFAQSPGFHYFALALVVPTALAAFSLGYRRHGALLPMLMGLAGIGCLVIALLPGAGKSIELWFTVAGSLFLVAGHMMNWRLRSHVR